MNPQPYELWLEHFSGMLRMNPRWDDYDRIALELFRQKGPLSVLEFGFTQKVADWSADRCFTVQMQWMAENAQVKCLSICPDTTKSFLCSKQFPEVQCLSVGGINEWFSLKISKPPFDLTRPTLVMMGELIPGAYDFKKLPSGTLIAVDKSVSLTDSDLPGLKLVRRGEVISLWKRA